MAYNLELERRIDKISADWQPDLLKKKMFGGIGYLVNGNMCCGIHKDDLIIRTSEDIGDEIMQIAGVRPFNMTKRPMKTWFMIEPKAVATDDQLEAMLETGFEYALKLPPK